MAKQVGYRRKTSRKSRTFKEKFLLLIYISLFLIKFAVVLKSIAFPLISLILVLSISASPIIPLLDEEMGKIMVIGAAEEESTKVITIEKFDEGDTFFKYFHEIANQQILLDNPMTHLRYIFPTSDCTLEILDPPPRKFS
tara:strand:+ start:16593 stop:17012 length:420 start_codon:yes stop_codon:yes gene_type:complete